MLLKKEKLLHLADLPHFPNVMPEYGE